MNATNKMPSQGQEPELDVIDIEEHSKSSNGKPPEARRYRIRVDREKFTVNVPGMLGMDILILAGKTPPERYLLNQKFRQGQVLPIGMEQYVDFTAPGVERFTTLPKDQTEGLLAGELIRRREFQLPEDDVLQLDSAGYQWETIPGNWLLVHEFPVPAGYNTATASVAVQIPSGYPTAQLDMAFFHPALQLTSGRRIPNTEVSMPVDGKHWQRWSRHYSPQNPWRAGEYNILTHLQLVRSWLERELHRH